MKNLIIINVVIIIVALCLCSINGNVEQLNTETDNSYEVSQTLKSVWDQEKIQKNIIKEFPEKEVNILFSAANRNNLTVEQTVILFSIRKAENGKSGKEMGIMNKKANTFDLQAGWCAATIQKNYDRWIKDGKKNSYIEFLGNRYCPTSGNLSNTEKELNGNWISNVEYWVHRLSN